MKKNKKIEKTKKEAINKIKGTTDLIDIEFINEKNIVLRKGRKTENIVGIKLKPHSLFLESSSQQAIVIHRLRNAFNQVNFPIYHAFVFNPINLDQQLFFLQTKLEYEEDKIVREMIEDDIDKLLLFIQNYRELEFFMIIKNKTDNLLQEQFHRLKFAIENAGFSISELNKIDYDNYLAYLFENPLANDYYFSRGIFSDAFNEQFNALGHDVPVERKEGKYV